MVVAVPNSASFPFKTFGLDCYASLSIPRHLTHFTEKSLGLALKLARFLKVRIQTVPFPAFLPSLLLRAGARYSDLQGGILTPIIAAFSLPLDLATQRQGQGAGLVATAARTLLETSNVAVGKSRPRLRAAKPRTLVSLFG